MTPAMAAADIDALWEFGDPAASEQRFRAALAQAEGDAALELQTQIARSYSLRQRWADAHRLLDEIAPRLASAGTAPRVRALLERGRTFNSAGERGRARALFEDAHAQAQAARLDGLAVDAAHMVAIALGPGDAALDWNRRGLALARRSTDAKARALIPAMLNNTAWDLLDQGRAHEALPWFDEALAAWRERARPPQVRIAQWSRAHALRRLGRHDEALAQLAALRAEHGDAAERDGHWHEELGENLLASGRPAEAARAFHDAARLLGADDAFAQANAARLSRLRELGADAPASVPGPSQVEPQAGSRPDGPAASDASGDSRAGGGTRADADANAGAASGDPAMARWRDEVLAAERAFARSMAERDRAGFARHLDDDAVFFAGQGAVLRGKAAVVAGWAGYFDGPTAPFSWLPDQVEVLAGGALALSTGPVHDVGGKPIARFNSVWRRAADGRWRVVFDKGSPPDPPP